MRDFSSALQQKSLQFSGHDNGLICSRHTQRGPTIGLQEGQEGIREGRGAYPVLQYPLRFGLPHSRAILSGVSRQYAPVLLMRARSRYTRPRAAARLLRCASHEHAHSSCMFNLQCIVRQRRGVLSNHCSCGVLWNEPSSQPRVVGFGK